MFKRSGRRYEPSAPLSSLQALPCVARLVIKPAVVQSRWRLSTRQWSSARRSSLLVLRSLAGGEVTEDGETKHNEEEREEERMTREVEMEGEFRVEMLGGDGFGVKIGVRVLDEWSILLVWVKEMGE
jgi:hypothetical protein